MQFYPFGFLQRSIKAKVTNFGIIIKEEVCIYLSVFLRHAQPIFETVTTKIYVSFF
jgi:hypothetical protein